MISMGPQETSNKGPVAFTGRPELDESNMRTKSANLTIETDYTNFTGTVLYLKTQRNIPFAINFEEGLHVPREIYPHLKVNVTYTIHDAKSMEETLCLIEAVINNDYPVTEEAVILRNKIKEQFNSNRYYDPNSKTVSFVMSRIVRRDDIFKAGVIYIPETNVTISMDKERSMRPHPYSPEGMQNVEFDKVLDNIGQSGIMVKVVDNNQIAPVRYFYAGKRLIAVASIVDQRRESGVYITITDRDIERKTTFVTFKEAEDSIGLYKSQEEALTHGDPGRVDARREQELVNANLALKNESLASKAALQQREAELATLKHDYTVMKEHLEYAALARKHQINSIDDRRKDYFEERSYVRKDSSELWKFIPLVVGVIIGVGGIFFGKR